MTFADKTPLLSMDKLLPTFTPPIVDAEALSNVKAPCSFTIKPVLGFTTPREFDVAILAFNTQSGSSTSRSSISVVNSVDCIDE